MSVTCQSRLTLIEAIMQLPKRVRSDIKLLSVQG